MQYGDDLRNALVGERHRSLYLNSPGFHTMIDSLALTLPLWINALADQAREVDGRTLADLERLSGAIGVADEMMWRGMDRAADLSIRT